MLTCIACSKELNNGKSLHQQEDEEEDDDETFTTLHNNNNKPAIKALTSQIKDMAVKASGAYKNCKPCTGSSKHSHLNGDCMDSETASVLSDHRFQCGYQRDCDSSTPRVWGKEIGARLKGFSSGRIIEEPVKFVEEDGVKEWVAQVEPGVLITFQALPQGGNSLKRIRFSREMFNKRQAQRWWVENCEKVMELYNVQHSNHEGVPPRSEDESSKIGSFDDSPMTPPLSKEPPLRNFHPKQACNGSSVPKTETSSLASARSSSSGEDDDDDHSEVSMSNASDLETEWVEQDEPGVYITIRALLGGKRELRRVRFSRDKFGETSARVWWEQNKGRIQEQYL